MAQITRTLRVILVPMLTDDTLVDHLFTLPALTTAATNGWFVSMYATVSQFGIEVPPGAMAIKKVIRIELLTTAANDANLVASSLPALQSQLSLATPPDTWSEVVTAGY